MNLQTLFLLAFGIFQVNSTAQNSTIEGFATDSTKGFNAIEIVVNDTLSKLMKNPKENRPKYLRMYQNPKFVVRTDSTGKFRIKARATDSLYFKSYKHQTEAFLVKDLMSKNPIEIHLKPNQN